MTPLQEAPHLLAMFRKRDAAGCAALVQRIREQAVRRLAGYAPLGFNAADNDHCVVAALHIGASTAPPSVKAAARLLRACVLAIEAPDDFDAAALVVTYAALDEHAVERDAEAQRARSAGGKAKPAKLPEAAALRAEVEQVRSARSLSDAEAKGIVRKRYGASAQAMNRKLKKT